MAIRPKFIKDICSVLYAIYFLVYWSEGDEVLRKFRALGTVEMLRTTWEKTNNPYVSGLAWQGVCITLKPDPAIHHGPTAVTQDCPQGRHI